MNVRGEYRGDRQARGFFDQLHNASACLHAGTRVDHHDLIARNHPAGIIHETLVGDRRFGQRTVDDIRVRRHLVHGIIADDVVGCGVERRAKQRGKEY